MKSTFRILFYARWEKTKENEKFLSKHASLSMDKR